MSVLKLNFFFETSKARILFLETAISASHGVSQESRRGRVPSFEYTFLYWVC